MKGKPPFRWSLSLLLLLLLLLQCPRLGGGAHCAGRDLFPSANLSLLDLA